MKVFAITYISEKTSGIETISVQTETVESALQNFREGKVVKIEEVNLYGKNIIDKMIK
jgi:predicted Fe-Mo cluster-binding NifX family protein